MTASQVAVFEIMNTVGLNIIIDEEPTQNSNVNFTYFGVPWVLRSDDSIYMNGFNFDDRGRSIESIVPPFLVSREQYLEEGYGQRRLYRMWWNGIELKYSNVFPYIQFEWDRRVEEEADRLSALQTRWNAYLGG